MANVTKRNKSEDNGASMNWSSSCCDVSVSLDVMPPARHRLRSVEKMLALKVTGTTVHPVALNSNGGLKKMKTRGFVVTLFAAAFAFAPQLLKSSTAASAEPDGPQGRYAAKLVSPHAGDVVFPGQKVRIVWEELLPKLPVDPSWCEAEIYLSLDGGKSFPIIITPLHLGSENGILSFDWTVLNTPTTAAVLDIRFGCEQYFPETRSVQTASSFVIGSSAAH